MSNREFSQNDQGLKARISVSNKAWWLYYKFSRLKISKCIATAIVTFLVFSFHTSAQLSKLDISTVQELSEDRGACRTKGLRFITNTTNDISIAIPIGLMVAGAIRNDRDMRKKALVVTESLALSTAVTFALKYTIKRSRPYTKDSLITKIGPGGGYSFPSGHTSQAFAVATSVAMAYPKWYIIAPAYLWAGTVAYSRMYLGVHYPSDILAGAIVGSGSAFLCYKVNKWISKSREAKNIASFTY